MIASKALSSDKWLTFVVNLPVSNTSLRMRVLRAMKGLGCAVLRDSVYLLPAGRGLRQTLRVYAEEIRNGGGNAHLLNVTVSSSEEKHQFQGMFDRSKEYQALLQEISIFRESSTNLEVGAARRRLKILHRELESITRVDYFPKPLRFEVEDILAEVETAFLSSLLPRIDHNGEVYIVPRERSAYQARHWATTQAANADNLASAWLVQRFIDPGAQFQWLDEGSEYPPETVRFGMAGGEFEASANLSTFDVFMASFDLGSHAGLVRMASVVHCLAVGNMEVAEAAGVDKLLKGILQNQVNSDVLQAESSRLFDWLYAAYTQE